ncbi:hypothetical protein L1049_014986 [Liquidambar formosana]|uniref:PUM-HD domain-containing protein n=1 Tax=Liquidambar formosana TaxID=63359 RepID=A0AAP0RXD5_LIQFO
MSSLNNDHQGQSPNYSSLEELRGKILMVAKDHNGRRFSQGKIEERKTQEIEMVFVELEDHFSELMVHRSGNFVIQSLIEVCNEEQINIILFSVISDKERLMAICVDMHGTRCIQKLLEHLTNRDQISLVVSVLRPFAITLSKNVNGHHVIQHCMKFFTYDDNKINN